jgi:hypothetical protein
MRSRPLAFVLIGLCIIDSLCYSVRWSERWELRDLFWDLHVYVQGARDSVSGVDAYQLSSPDLTMIYNPLVLHFFAAIQRVVDLQIFLVAFYAAVAAWFCVEALQTVPPATADGSRRQTDWPDIALLLLCAVSFGDVGIGAFLSGNVGTYLHLTIFSIMLGFFRTRHGYYRYLFATCIVLFSIAKPFFLIYLPLLAFLFDNWRSRLLTAALIVTSFALLWYASELLFPAEYGHFLLALKHSTLEKGDIGYSFFAIGRLLLRMSDYGALTLHLLVTACLAYLAVFPIPRILSLTSPVEKFLLLLPVLVLANPRMKEYDFFTAVIAFFLLSLRVMPVRYMRVALVGLSLLLLPVLPIALEHLFGIRVRRLLDAPKLWELASLAAMALLLVYFRRQSVTNESPAVAPS